MALREDFALPASVFGPVEVGGMLTMVVMAQRGMKTVEKWDGLFFRCDKLELSWV